MSYVVPIHRASSIRDALKLNFMDPEKEALVVAKSNRLEIYSLTPEGLSLAASCSLNARVTMLARLPAPVNSPTDHLFVGTDRYTYCTLSWDSETNQVQTERNYVDIADPSSREAQTSNRCLIDPSGRFMTLEVYEGVISVVPIVQLPSKRRGRQVALPTGPDAPRVGELGEPTTARIDELFVRSSAFLHVQSGPPRMALLYEDNQKKVRLKVRALTYSGATASTGADAAFEDSLDGFSQELDLGASHLVPVPAPLGGLLVLGETSIKYVDTDSNEIVSRPLDEATIFVAWEQVDSQRWLLADDYGRLFFLMLVLDSNNQVQSWKLDHLGDTSRASVLIYLGGGIVFVGSHQGDSQVIRIGTGSLDVIQTLSNIAPILDFTIMDLGNRISESQTHEFSSGQARIVTGSGAFDDGTLRSVRSGVGMEELGVLGEMEHITDLFGLQIAAKGGFLDTLLVTFVDETRVFHFNFDGEVEELDNFLGLSLSESTLLAVNLPGGRILQITEQRVLIADIEGGMVTYEWTPPNQLVITAASANNDSVVLVIGGQIVTVLDIKNDPQVVSQKDFGADSQVSGVTVPMSSAGVCIVGFPQLAKVSVLDLQNLSDLHTTSLGPPGEAFPRSVLVADVLADSPSTLFISMADGSVITYSFDSTDFSLTGMNKLILGSEQPTFKKLPRYDGLYNVFATCENPSLIYGSEGRIIYSAVNSEGASRVCHFNSEVYPGSIAVATSHELKIALVDKQRTTQIQTLPIGATARRVAYSPSEKAFGIGTIERKLKDGAEMVHSQFVLADEILFRRLDWFDLRPEELVESVIRTEFAAGKDEHGRETTKDRFIVGTAYLDDETEASIRGRILVFEIDNGRKLTKVAELPVKGACRALAMLGDKIVAALVKTVVIYGVVNNNFGAMKLEKLASYRTSTAPVDVTVTGDVIAVADLMKSVCLVKYNEGENGLPDTLTEVARHFQTVWTTGVACIAKDTFLESDAEGNLLVLRRNLTGVEEEDKRRLEVTGEISLGEMVNRIRPVNIQQLASVMVTPRAFLATVEGSIYLFAIINPEHQDFLMRLQATMAGKVESLGNIPFNEFRGFRSMVREVKEPYRFVDGELIERFLTLEPSVQEGIADSVGLMPVDEVKVMIEALRRLH
ncbi:damage-specific DNA binding protein [Aspergillus heteromorphus CBS 117.55]|uniref:DNA damage-binding protein 1 n=1 Tax=Aspergillus heteromorphus CBS 117.55 TaxID=1448321 RepID=A0A317WUS7_9EURO|nr:damage-specific DNA binding protein [Aspergillus heteromorphus CBS 117.55]PWY89835.1 damage-specific DNA binding protein [Aspergillus heteromorphus CBS 117.55]